MIEYWNQILHLFFGKFVLLFNSRKFSRPRTYFSARPMYVPSWCMNPFHELRPRARNTSYIHNNRRASCTHNISLMLYLHIWICTFSCQDKVFISPELWETEAGPVLTILFAKWSHWNSISCDILSYSTLWTSCPPSGILHRKWCWSGCNMIHACTESYRTYQERATQVPEWPQGVLTPIARNACHSEP